MQDRENLNHRQEEKWSVVSSQSLVASRQSEGNESEV